METIKDPLGMHLLQKQFEVGKNIANYFIEERTSRCCGRCDGVHDLCITDTLCDTHDVMGCEICFGKR